MVATVDLRGGGGVVQTFDLPLSEAFANQVARGDLVPATDADTAALAGPAKADDAAVVVALERPDEIDGVAVWRAYAIEQGMDPDEAKAMKKPGLIARFPAPEPVEDDEDEDGEDEALAELADWAEGAVATGEYPDVATALASFT